MFNNFLNDANSRAHSEKGRSLIEIIAILVIMAILLIAALLGFKALLDYLKKKETASQISTIGMRYRTDRLGKVRKTTGHVDLREVYPEGSDCDGKINDHTCVRTPDGGRIQLYAYEDTTSFVVVASNIQPISCEEAVMAGGYTKVKRLPNKNDEGTEFTSSGTIFKDATQIFNSNSGEYKDAAYFKEHPGELYDFCSSAVAFVYANHSALEGENCEHFYDGKCHECPNGQTADKNGDCCSEASIDCGVCGGCKEGFCSEDKCVECVTDQQCVDKHGHAKPYCVQGRCRPCKSVGAECLDSSGSGLGGLYCDDNYECSCQECKKRVGNLCVQDSASNGKKAKDACHMCQDGEIVLRDAQKSIVCGDQCCKNGAEQCYNGECKSTSVICNECQIYDGTQDRCIADPSKNGQEVLDACHKCQNGEIVLKSSGRSVVCENKKVCCPYGYICNAFDKCNCPEPHTVKEGESCTGDCPNSCGTADDGSPLVCRNGVCARETSATCKEDGFGEDPRNKGEKCKADCPCNEAAKLLLGCRDGQCKCSSLPTAKGKECWGECGCGIGLDCSSKGKAEMGTCACKDPVPTKGESCIKECGCDDGLKCNPSFKCECDPPAYSEVLPAGALCAGEEVCPKQCATGLCRTGSADGKKHCCPEPKGYSCEKNKYDADGCLEYEYKPCPPDKHCLIEANGDRCVECLTHEDCPEGEFCGPYHMCVPCPTPSQCCDKEDTLFTSGDYAYRCYEFRHFDCPTGKLCRTGGATTCHNECVQCNEDTDCEGNTYCDPDTLTCKDCDTCASKGLTCCKEVTPISPKNRCKVPTDRTDTVTYTKLVGGVCQVVTEPYCPLIGKPSDQCSMCNKCQEMAADGSCKWKKNASGKTYQVACGTACCATTPACKANGTECCRAITSLSGTRNECSTAAESTTHICFNSTKTFTVDSDHDMTLYVHVLGILKYDSLSVCEVGGSCIIDKPSLTSGNLSSHSGQILIWKPGALKAGRTYEVKIKLENWCDHCDVEAHCAGASKPF